MSQIYVQLGKKAGIWNVFFFWKWKGIILHVICNLVKKIKALPASGRVQYSYFNRAEQVVLLCSFFVLFCTNAGTQNFWEDKLVFLSFDHSSSHVQTHTHLHFFRSHPFIRLVTLGVTWGEMQMIPSSTPPASQTTPITLLWLQKLLSSNSCGETQSFTTALSSILSGFEWIKGKVKQWKAIKRFL